MKEIGFYILCGIISIILFFFFPKTMSWGITVGSFIAAAIVVLGGIKLKKDLERSRQLETEIENELDDLDKQPKRPRQQFPANSRRFYFEISVYSVGIICALTHSLLKDTGNLTPQKDTLLFVVALFAASVFCTCNLFWGIREKRTWCRGFLNIARSESPCNYWVAICLWIFFTVGFLAEFISKIVDLTSG